MKFSIYLYCFVLQILCLQDERDEIEHEKEKRVAELSMYIVYIVYL